MQLDRMYMKKFIMNLRMFVHCPQYCEGSQYYRTGESARHLHVDGRSLKSDTFRLAAEQVVLDSDGHGCLTVARTEVNVGHWMECQRQTQKTSNECLNFSRYSWIVAASCLEKTTRFKKPDDASFRENFSTAISVLELSWFDENVYDKQRKDALDKLVKMIIQICGYWLLFPFLLLINDDDCINKSTSVVCKTSK